MASSEVEIVNSALIKIGEDTIVSLDQDTKAARVSKRQYPLMRDALVRGFLWNFAIKRVSLALKTTAPAFGFTHAFALPADNLRIIGVHDERERVENYTSSREPWKVENGSFLFTENVANVFYVAQIEDVSLFDPIFSEALAYKLAMDLAYALSTGLSRIDTLVALFDAEIKNARIADAITGKPEIIIASDWIDSRFFYNGPPRIGPVFT